MDPSSQTHGIVPSSKIPSTSTHSIPPTMDKIHSDPATSSVLPSPLFDLDALLRRVPFSVPLPYSGVDSATHQSTVQLTTDPSSQEHGIAPSSKIPFSTAHKYILKSCRRDYATTVVMSRAHSILYTSVALRRQIKWLHCISSG